MKNNRSFLRKYAAILALTAASIVFLPAACTKDSFDEVPATGVITMTTLASEVSFDILAGSSNITVNWGDGKESNTDDAFYDEVSNLLTFSHSYSSASEHRITITDHSIASSSTKGTSEAYSDTALTYLDCTGNQLSTLDVSGFPALMYLFCGNNQLKTLDLSNNAELIYLESQYNQFITLDLSHNIALVTLHCFNNQLTTLNVSSNIALKVFICSYNQLTTLDVTHNNELMYLFCDGNQLSDSALNALFRTLHNNPDVTGKYIYIRNNPGAGDCDFSIAEEKGWIMFNGIRPTVFQNQGIVNHLNFEILNINH